MSKIRVVGVLLTVVVVVGVFFAFREENNEKEVSRGFIKSDKNSRGDQPERDYLRDEEIVLQFGSRGTFIPENWTGLPIDYDNKLFKNFSGTIPREACGLFLALSGKHSGSVLHIHLAEWIPRIGFNSLMDCVTLYQMEIPPQVEHEIGMALAEYAPSNPRHLVQVTSRNVLHKAPLHGAVWKALELQSWDDARTLTQYIDAQLCYFKSYAGMGEMWVSCVHGVGHAFGEIFGIKRINTALDYCATHSDPDWMYSCASGVFMALSSKFSNKDWHPCDEVQFPAACFRFKNLIWTLKINEQIKYPCKEISDDYHKRGCIWGFGYVMSQGFSKASMVCNRYLSNSYWRSDQGKGHYVACLDGAFHASHWEQEGPQDFEARKLICNDLRTSDAIELCLHYASFNRLNFTATEHHWWSWDLLELGKT